MPCKTSLNQQSCWSSVLIQGLRWTGKPLMILYVIAFSYIFVCCMQIYVIFLTTPSVFANFFFWNFFFLVPFLDFPCEKVCFSYALPPKILHRYSIVTPSIVHRFDGESMELWWRCDGTTPYFRLLRMGLTPTLVGTCMGVKEKPWKIACMEKTRTIVWRFMELSLSLHENKINLKQLWKNLSLFWRLLELQLWHL